MKEVRSYSLDTIRSKPKEMLQNSKRIMKKDLARTKLERTN